MRRSVSHDKRSNHVLLGTNHRSRGSLSGRGRIPADVEEQYRRAITAPDCRHRARRLRIADATRFDSIPGQRALNADRALRQGQHERDSVLTFGVAEQLLNRPRRASRRSNSPPTRPLGSGSRRPSGRCLSMLRVGYRIRLSSGKGPDREGVVTALVGSMLRVRWSSQEETIVSPAPGTLTVLASSGDDAPSALSPRQPRPKQAAPKKAAAKTTPNTATPRKAAPKTAAARKAAPTRRRARRRPHRRRRRRVQRRTRPHRGRLRRRRPRRRRRPQLGRRRPPRGTRRASDLPGRRRARVAASRRRARSAGVADHRCSVSEIAAPSVVSEDRDHDDIIGQGRQRVHAVLAHCGDVTIRRSALAFGVGVTTGCETEPWCRMVRARWPPSAHRAVRRWHLRRRSSCRRHRAGPAPARRACAE